MPKQKSKHHPLSTIRKAAGLTQKELGVLLGVSRHNIREIENDPHRTISAAMARKLQEQFGCRFSVTDGSAPGKEHWELHDTLPREDGKYTRYTLQDFESHQAGLKSMADEDLGAIEPGLVAALQIILRAAHMCDRLPNTASGIEKALIHVVNAYDLKHSAETFLREKCGYSPADAINAAVGLTSSPVLVGLEAQYGIGREGSAEAFREALATVETGFPPNDD